MPQGLKLMHILLYGALIMAVIAIVLFIVAGIGRNKK
jgi:hypothetical protein